MIDWYSFWKKGCQNEVFYFFPIDSKCCSCDKQHQNYILIIANERLFWNRCNYIVYENIYLKVWYRWALHKLIFGHVACYITKNINTSQLSVSFLVQPEFISNPENLTVTEGEDVNLQCEVSGNPIPDVRWTKDGEAVNITDQRINVSFMGNTSILRIVSVVQADQGLYRCVANNSVNTQNSFPGTLTIHCEYFIVFFPLSLMLNWLLKVTIIYL